MTMKKFFTSLIALMAVLLCSSTAQAGVAIAGKGVSSTGNVTGTWLTSGTVNYNASSNTITLTNANVTLSSNDFIQSTGSTSLTIRVQGTCTFSLTGDSNNFLYAETGVSINSVDGQAPGYLTVTSNGRSVWMGNNAYLNIWNTHVDLTSKNLEAMYGAGSTSLYTAWTWLKAKGGSGKYGIDKFKSWDNMAGGTTPMSVTTDGQTFDTSRKGFVLNGTQQQTTTIEPSIIIGGAPLNAAVSSITFNSSTPGAGITSGTVTWNLSTKTLTLSGVSLSSASGITNNGIDGLTINVTSSSSVTATSGTAMRLRQNTTISSTSTSNRLTATASSSTATAIQLCPLENNTATTTLTVKSIHVLAEGGGRGFEGYQGYGGRNCDLVFEKAYVNTKGSNYGSLVDFGNVSMKGCDIENPSGAHLLASSGRTKVVQGSSINAYKDWVDIHTAAEYDLYVAGKQLNSVNAHNFYSPYLTAGSVTYDNSTKTLTLNNAVISGQTGTVTSNVNCGIYNEVSGLTINTVGTNAITTATTAIAVKANTTFTGSGKFDVRSTGASAISTYNNASVTLKREGTMYAFGSNYGFYGEIGGTLTVNHNGSNSGDYFFSGANGNIYTGDLVFDNKTLLYDPYTWFNKDTHCVYLKNERATSANSPATNNAGVKATNIYAYQNYGFYDIYINGTRLNNRNAQGYWDQYVKGGEITYSSSSRTLTLNGATVDTGTGNFAFLRHRQDIGLTVSVKGTNTITNGSANYSTVVFEENGVITQGGNGKLILNGSNNSPICVYEGKNLDIAGGVEVSSANGAIYGRNNDAGMLTVNASTLDAKSLYGFSNIVLDGGTGYAIPNSGTYSSSTKHIQWNGSDYSGRVLIKPLESYGIYLAGIEANSYNADDIFADPMYQASYGKSGSAKYIPSQHKLQLSGVNITAPDDIDGVTSKSSNDFIVEFSGDNTIKASGNGDAIYSNSTYGAIDITGTTGAKLTASNNASSHPALLLCKDATIKGIDITANGLNGRGSSALEIQDATLSLSGFSDGTISGFSDVTLGAGLMYSKPSGAAYDTSAKTLMANGSKVTGEVKIEQGTEYPLTIAGISVSSTNASSISGMGISGSVSYDNATKTLTLTDATISKTGTQGIKSELAQLNIVLNGTNKIENGKSFASVTSTGNVNISGSGSLTTSFNIIVYGNLAIDNTTLISNGRLRGQYVGSSSVLSVTNSNVKVNTSEYPITEWGSLVLDGCAITTPAGADFSSTDGCLFVGSNKYTGNLVIEPAESYGIFIAGVEINDKNAADIPGATGGTGQMTVTRNGGKTTITMNNFRLSGTDLLSDNIIGIGEDAGDVTINLIGENVINSTRPDDDGLISIGNAADHNYVITGNGSLKSNACYGIHGNRTYSTLRIDGTELEVVMLYDFKDIKIVNSTVNLAGDNNYGTIEDVGALGFEGCDFTAPTGAYFDATNFAVYVGSERVVGAITIEPQKKYGITIAGIPVTDLNASAITGEGITGNVSWNAGTGRLRLDNAAIDGGAEPAIAIDGNAIGNVQIELVGNNKLESNVNGIAVSGTCNVGISSVDGTGLLRIKAGLNGIDGANRLAIANATADIVGDQIGVRGGTLDIQGGAIVGITAVSGTQALTDMVGIDLATNMIVAAGATDQQMVAFGEDYGFSINGQRVTSYAVALDENDLYDPASKTLTINNVNLPTYIDNEKCAGLTFKVSGANTFVGGDKPVIRTQQPIVIDGTGTLTLTSDVTAIDATADVTIKGGVAVSVSGTTAIDGHNTSTLHIDNSVVTLSGSDQVVKDLAALDLTGVSISEPANAVFADGTVKVDGTPVSAASVIIGDVKSYGIDVAGIDITTVNAGSVESTDITKGTVSYDDGTKTLTLNNVDIAGTVTIADEVSDIINIQLIGDNTVTASDAKAFYTKNGGFRFFSDGTGSLAITASGLGSTAVTAEKAITFDNCLVIADGGERGFSGVTMNCVVTIDNAAVRVKGSQSCVAGMKNIVLAGGVVANPTADGNKAIKVNDFGSKIEYASSGDVVRDTWVDLSESYGMAIGSTLLTRAVAYKGTTAIATGVNYTHATRTLSLANATIDGIWNAGTAPLNVVIDGEVTVNSSAYGTGSKKPAIYAAADVNITANTTAAALTLDGGSFSPAILGEGEATVTIANHLTALAKGMRGVYSEDKQLTLVIDNATLMAQGTQQSIAGLKALTMTGCGITVPANAVFNPATGAVELGGSVVSGQMVTIDPSGDGIDSIIATTDAGVEAIYSVDGKKLDRTRSGVNIVRKSDGSVTKVLRK